MAHQTSKISQKQSTPHSIGRLMDADFLRMPCLPFLGEYESRIGAVLVCKPT
jgi:hypothetical protein